MSLKFSIAVFMLVTSIQVFAEGEVDLPPTTADLPSSSKKLVPTKYVATLLNDENLNVILASSEGYKNYMKTFNPLSAQFQSLNPELAEKYLEGPELKILMEQEMYFGNQEHSFTKKLVKEFAAESVSQYQKAVQRLNIQKTEIGFLAESVDALVLRFMAAQGIGSVFDRMGEVSNGAYSQMIQSEIYKKSEFSEREKIYLEWLKIDSLELSSILKAQSNPLTEVQVSKISSQIIRHSENLGSTRMGYFKLLSAFAAGLLHEEVYHTDQFRKIQNAIEHPIRLIKMTLRQQRILSSKDLIR